MMDEEDPFSGFDEDEEKSKNGSGGSVDKMKKIEEEKQIDSKSRAANLIEQLKQGQTGKRVLESADGGGEDGGEGDEQQDGGGRKAAKMEEEGGDDDGTGAVANDEEFTSLESLPRIQIHEISTVEGCRHQVAVPHGEEYKPLVEFKGEPVKTFPFELDPFQKEAVQCLNNNQSVLVSAHTSAGKTVVGLYAIAMALRDHQRVIYTTPIKALSNQKYRELEEEFQDVGLMTGDVTYKPDASCIVMTTEILRSMLYRGSEIMREVGWVIFDEIHYMRDKERGVVWEETIILLPDNVHYVFLSATIPNAIQFAEWVCFLHNQCCHVVYTDYRPVPLQHYVFPAQGEALYLAVDDQGKFREETFTKAMAGLDEVGEGQTKRRNKKLEGSNVVKVMDLLLKKKLNPVIVFSFARRDCEAYAGELDRLDLNTDDEKKLVKEIFDNAIDVLSDEDKTLPQVTNILPLLMKGIGIHHSGLLPILKETIEILFGEGLIKALFATETFAMGLNMPARCVLFTSARKFDGKDYRWLSSGEYIQMSGRSGRRGKDKRGLVIMMVDQAIPIATAKTILKGAADPLNSQFRLTYNMILNLLRVEGINPEYMLERSFYQFQNYSSLPALYSKEKKSKDDFERIKVSRLSEIEGYYKIKEEISKVSKSMQEVLIKPMWLVPFLQPGRLIRVKEGENDFGWGCLVNFHKKPNKDPFNNDPIYILDVLLYVNEETFKTNQTVSALKPPFSGERGTMEVVPVMINLVQRISAVRIKYPEDLRPKDKRLSVYKIIEEVKKRFPDDGIPLLDPIEDMKITDKEFISMAERVKELTERLHKHPLNDDSQLVQLSETYERKIKAETAWRTCKSELKKAKSLLQMDELKCRKRVLRRLGYADAQDVITQKGRVACEISAADELLLTEMIFNDAFTPITSENCAALLSCFVFQENAEAPGLSEQMQGILRQMQEMARRIAKVTKEAKLDILEEDKYVEQFKPHLMDVVHAWCSGAKFIEICQKTDIFEGSIIRCMRRLEELLREMVGASKAIGNKDLEEKFAKAITAMKRDIVFAASLYL